MKISVLGAGAMGSLFGGLLAEAGHLVELLDVNTAHIARVREQGLTLQTDQGTRVVQVSIGRPEETHNIPDWLIVFTKTLHTTSALESARYLLGTNTRVLSLQNGLGNADKLAAFVPLARVAIGVTTVPADLIGPGQVHSHGEGSIKLMMAAVHDNEHDDDALSALVDAFNAIGLKCSVDASVQSAIWEKVAFNAAFNSLCAVSGCTVGQLADLPAGRELAHAIAREVLSVAHAQGVPVNVDAVRDSINDALAHHRNHKPSMLQDILADRPTEIDAINAAVVRAAQLHRIAVPKTEALCTLVHLRERLAVSH